MILSNEFWARFDEAKREVKLIKGAHLVKKLRYKDRSTYTHFKNRWPLDKQLNDVELEDLMNEEILNRFCGEFDYRIEYLVLGRGDKKKKIEEHSIDWEKRYYELKEKYDILYGQYKELKGEEGQSPKKESLKSSTGTGGNWQDNVNP